MVLTQLLGRWAARRPHVLAVAAPGATAVRLAVEVEMARIGAVAATAPSDADVLLAVGSPGDELRDAIDLVWSQLPGPRVRADIDDPAEAGAVLRQVVRQLSDPQRAAEPDRRDEWAERAPDTHGEDMQMPGGLMMADRGPDRDALALDVLTVPLGPVLPDWPSGLVMDLQVQGDVVQQARSRILSAATPPRPFWDAAGPGASRRHAAAHLDSLQRLLAVAGWPGMAWRVRRLRDSTLTDTPGPVLRGHLAAIGRRLNRSPTLRWATDGLGVLTAETADRLQVSGPAARAALEGGDVTARWRRWLTETDALLAGEPAGPGPRGRSVPGRPASAGLLAAADELAIGLDLAAARLVMASLDPDPDQLAAAPEPAEARS
ncbi:hypothetical protein [Pseudosporangium ferrugineum]|uniref:Uncharacterized protein n=1 Tax=Pseudosporangium ferrugineum TaxID=439699 RepID=A0A2T0RG67_9ACTN|nr:hypothetical protein [Pseudosporangium ferrugineum]PRY20155.1 hypothetical protein CLV70_12536 [Pseudosporangium ferrugineum]